MKAEDIFIISKELSKKELEKLLILLKRHLNNSSPKARKEIITRTEANKYLLEKVFKINKGKVNPRKE